jgi:hypothetical protein
MAGAFYPQPDERRVERPARRLDEPARSFSSKRVACEEMAAATSHSIDPARIDRWHPEDGRAGLASEPDRWASMEPDADSRPTMVPSESTSGHRVSGKAATWASKVSG